MSNLQLITYKLHDGEEGFVYGYLTPDVDVWGKHTVKILLANGDLENWYLFSNEYTAEEVL